MSFGAISESGLLYGCVITGIALVLLITIYYLVVCYRHCLVCGITREKLKEVIKSSALFSVVPSIAVVAGLASLVTVIGIPYAWFRLSVIGSVAYELMSANMALGALQIDLASAGGDAFGLMMWAMCIPITVTIVFNLFLVKKIHLGAIKLGGGDDRWKAVAQSVFMTALVLVLVVPLIGGGVVSLLTFTTSAVIGLLITIFSTKRGFSWIESFALAFSLLGAMASSVLWASLFS